MGGGGGGGRASYWHWQVTQRRVVPPRIKSLIPAAELPIIFLVGCVDSGPEPSASRHLFVYVFAFLGFVFSPLCWSFFWAPFRTSQVCEEQQQHLICHQHRVLFSSFFFSSFFRSSLSYSRCPCGRHLLFCSDFGRHPPTLD